VEEILFIDFETYSKCNIKFGSFRYAQDKSTEILCMAYCFGVDGEVKLWHPDLSTPYEVIDHIKKGGIVRSYNVTFEYCIFNYVTHRIFLWPKLKYDQVKCTMTDGLALALPSNLKDIGTALNLSQEKDTSGKRLINLLSKPRKPTKNKPYKRVTKDIDPESFQELYNYCIQDVKTEIAVYKSLPRHIKGFELEMFRKTLEINERGIYIDLPLVKGVLRDKEIYEEKLNHEIKEITNGEMTSTNSRMKAMKWLKEKGLELEGYTKLDIKKALKNDLDKDVKRFLEIRSELSRTPIKKYDYLNSAICEDNTLKNNLIFHKATTGRYAGVGFQIQNMPRDAAENPEELINKFNNSEDIKGRNIYNESISLLRNVLVAPKNHKMVVSDFSGIENRVVAWLSEDDQTLEDFKNGIDQYKVAASSIFKVDYNDVTKDQRQLGKISVLSCCFGGGYKTFHKICNDGWGIPIELDLAEEVVEGYRYKYKKIVKLWYGAIGAAEKAIITGQVHVYKHLKFNVIDDYLYMRLPSGRLLAYYKPDIEKVKTPWGSYKNAITHLGINTYTRKWERLVMTHGRLTENATQAVARDILNVAVDRAEKAGFKTVGLVHDEIITIVKNDNDLNIEKLNSIMSESINWCSEMPIDAEGFEGMRYKK